ncbi:MAG: alanine racemase [Oscillospiraceae bacterium]|nr:alanine racemase [Oscillospiraceae bacterium]
MPTHYLRTWAEISLDAVEANVNALRARLAPGPKGSSKEPLLMCVIKADAYGHGALPLARFLEDKCEYYAVAVLEEALTLRAAGVAKPMLLLCYTSPAQYEALLAADVAQTVYSLEQARALSQAAVSAAKRAKVHIKVDTGMARIGFADTDISVEEVAQIARLPGLELEGLYTHYACADEADQTGALAQRARFEAFTRKLEKAGVNIPLKHSCNSAAAMAFDTHGDLVRFGIGLYGLYPSEEVRKESLPLRPAMSWKTHVAHLKTVPPGTGVSYGHTFVTQRETRVATLPVGYADGYPRALSNRGHVIIRGQYAPIIGRVCMDQCMVDVTDIPGVRMEDEAVLLGESGPCRVTMEELGAMSASFNYETACRVSGRVPRVYLYHGEAVDFRSVLTTEEEFLQG